jgi:hypothetical protein
MRLRALALTVALGFSLAGMAQAKKAKPVNHRVSASKVKPRKAKGKKFKHPKFMHPKGRR